MKISSEKRCDSYNFLDKSTAVQIPVDACPLFGLKRRSFLFVIDTLTPQPCVVGFSLPSCVLVPFADAIATACNNRHYIHFVLYKSPGCTTLTPQPCVVGFSLPSCVLVPFADAIATACNNRHYIHFVLYKSPGCTTLTPQPCVVGFLFFLCRIAPYSRQQQTVACFQNLAMVYLSCKEIK